MPKPTQVDGELRELMVNFLYFIEKVAVIDANDKHDVPSPMQWHEWHSDDVMANDSTPDIIFLVALMHTQLQIDIMSPS